MTDLVRPYSDSGINKMFKINVEGVRVLLWLG